MARRPPRETDRLDAGLERVKENPLVEITGEFGRWQLLITVFLFISNCFSAINALSGAFYAPNLDYWCVRPAQYQVRPRSPLNPTGSSVSPPRQVTTRAPKSVQRRRTCRSTPGRRW